MTTRAQVLALAALGFACVTPPAAACPWANGSYLGTVPPGTELQLQINGGCSRIQITNTATGDVQTFPMTREDGDWRVTVPNGAVLEFAAAGDVVRGRRGILSRTLSFKRQN